MSAFVNRSSTLQERQDLFTARRLLFLSITSPTYINNLLNMKIIFQSTFSSLIVTLLIMSMIRTDISVAQVREARYQFFRPRQHQHPPSPCLNSPLNPVAVGASKDLSGVSHKCGPSNGVVFILNDWLSSRVNIEVASIILQEKLGICVDSVALTVLEGLQLMNQQGNETPLVLLEFWKINRYDEFRTYVQNGKYTSEIGELGPQGRIGWYIPEFMLSTRGGNSELDQFVRSYRYFRTTPEYRLVTGSTGWAMVDKQIVRNLKLNLKVEQPPENGTELYLMNQLDNAQRDKTPVVVALWTPHQIFSSPHPPQRVYLPSYSEDCRKQSNIERGLVDCDYPPTTLSKIQTDAVLKLPQQVQIFLKKFKYQSADQIQMMGDIYYKQMDPRDAACKWLKNNTALWMSWLKVPEPPVSNLRLSIGIAVAAALLGILVIAIATLFIGCVIRKNSMRKTENRYAPKNPPICIVFTHIQNASLLWTLDSDTMKKAMNIQNKVMRHNVRRFRGYEVKTHLDCFMMAFSDPIDAVACCMQIQKDLLECQWTNDMMAFPDMQPVVWNGHVVYNGPRVRMGIHYGSDIQAQFDPTTRRYDYFGTTVNKASRVARACESGGRVYISEETFQFILHVISEFKPMSRKESFSNLEVLNSHSYHFKHAVSRGQIVFESVGEYKLKGLEGKHTIYWVKDLHNARSEYIEQFEMISAQRPSSLQLTNSPPFRIDLSEKAKYDFKVAIENALNNPSKLSEDEKSILIQRFVLWSVNDSNDITSTSNYRDKWMEHPDTSLMKFIVDLLSHDEIKGSLNVVTPTNTAQTSVLNTSTGSPNTEKHRKESCSSSSTDHPTSQDEEEAITIQNEEIGGESEQASSSRQGGEENSKSTSVTVESENVNQ
ncbi:hypothetical protein C9374_007416 [Naegleria lovaniensis]|uniref:Guanylate cyclase domain-containing protein n=1 Tax=Naegleria lovaniensis TaxID=51637 RepID=A0AA88GKW6_NAELO|nr:uncharacterized protein C9374_007416 [Naegleria lovaniensis]KAG2379277.1 hypothetical protein C9374_007416 [Naegleria lovaniensis]